MKNTLLNISGKIDAKTVQLYKAIAIRSNELNIPFVVIGASARDIVTSKPNNIHSKRLRRINHERIHHNPR